MANTPRMNRAHISIRFHGSRDIPIIQEVCHQHLLVARRDSRIVTSNYRFVVPFPNYCPSCRQYSCYWWHEQIFVSKILECEREGSQRDGDGQFYIVGTWALRL